MFEAHVLHLLRRYLDEYVHGLSGEALRISVWNGDVTLKDLKLKAEALNSLKLPVIVKAGFVGSISLKVPWNGLGNEPVIVKIDSVFILAHPAHDGKTMKKEDIEKLFEAKLQQIEEAESATLEAIAKSKQGTQSNGSSWLGSLIGTIIGNLKISISNVHIRYEDSVSNPGYPFSSGITLAKLAAVTMDEFGNETFDTSGALDKLRKSLHLERLALYHDSNSVPWKIDKRWEDLSPKEWIEIFEDGITDCITVSKWAMNRNYLVSPINGVLQYHRLGNQERNDPEVPFEKAALVLSDVSLRITEAQYHDWIKLLEVVSRYRVYIEVSYLRPLALVSKAPNSWWRYAAQASLQQKKMCHRFSWDRIQLMCHLRRRYIHLYAGALQQISNVDKSEIRDMERHLDSKVILLWRLLAHAKVESVKSKEAAEQMRLKKGGWFSFSWSSESEDASADTSEGHQLSEERLTNEEWEAVQNLLSYQPDEESTTHTGKEGQNMIQLLVTVSIGQAAARIISINDTEIVCGRFEQLHVSTKFKNRSIQCDVLLKYYGLSVPEGSLAKSVCSEQKANALTASFVHLPIGENVDWKLSAIISPCHVTVLMESCDRFLEFVKRSNAVSPTVAFETATALQMKIEKVTRRAQEQFQTVLEEQSRFALDIDFDAPKVRVPIKKCGSSEQDSHFLLDFGHFTVHTNEHQPDEQRQNLYSRFYISGRDIAALFTDHCPDCEKYTLVMPNYCDQQGEPMMDRCTNFYSLIDRCGIAVTVDQIKVPHPSYPSSRISVQVPNLSIHLSPERYGRLMELLNMLQGTIETCAQPDGENSQAEVTPWSSTDLATSARILVWTGIGNSVATWQPCFLVLSGLYLYVLESDMSMYYQRYLSMASRRVHEVPLENVGGSQFCLAVSFRGMDIQNALVSSSTWVIEFQDMDEKAIWLKRLVQATYKASAPPSVGVIGELNDSGIELDGSHATEFKAADLVINGSLLETKLFVYGKGTRSEITVNNILQTGHCDDKHLEENLIVEVFIGGAKVHVIRWEGDLTVKMKLHSLKIKDELQGRQSMKPQYLAFSILKNETVGSSTDTFDSSENVKESPVPMVEDDDVFTDALPEFLSLSDLGFSPDNMDKSHSGMMRDIVHSAGVESPVGLSEKDPGKGKGISGDIFYEAHEGEGSDFVCVTFATKSPGSPSYDGIDTQMNIRMSQLEFFFNRPTLVALIGFGSDLGNSNSTSSSTEETKTSDDILSMTKEKAEEIGRIKGLLGFGKGRVVFYFNMNVDSVSVFLNKEDGSQLAMLVQESFLLDFKVYPGSISIEGTLGNLRLCDMSLGADHCWGWLCDIRNPGVESLIKFKFNSYSAEDDDYEGYDYSLSGRLSAVRIVFLYRFVSEITAYFMEIATPAPEEAIQLVDKVGDFEWLIQKCEFDGATALKLDLSLDTPIIILPKNSTSKDSIQFDMGQLRVTNELIWHGCPDIDSSAVHIDILHFELLGMKMSVGIDGSLGRPVIRESRGFDVYIRRSLRDVFRKVPTFSLEVKIGLLHGVMSDKEYRVSMDCPMMNLCEEPNLPPSFRGTPSDSKDAMQLLADKVNMNSQILLSRTVSIMAVEINYALLELCSGNHEVAPLAHIALEGLWVSYRMTQLSEADLYVTIPKFSILDVRSDTKPEMRLMLGSSSDASKQSSTGKISLFAHKVSFLRPNVEAGEGDIPYSTMFLMDYRWRLSSQSFVIRIQQPRVLVVPDFLLAVGEFFVPSLKSITGRDETMDPTNDPISCNICIALSEPVYRQKEDVVYLSPSKQLVADTPEINEYIYDGCGKLICLTEEAESKECHIVRSSPIIIIGRGKRLRFVNVKIENGSLLRKYAYLSNDSSYSVSSEDGVDIVFLDNSSPGIDKKSLDNLQNSSNALDSASNPQIDSNTVQSFTFEAQLLSPEFTFYDGTKSSLDDLSYGEKLLRARMDLSFMYAIKEKDTWIRALLKDLSIEAGSGLSILDPVDISGGYTSVKDKTNISLLSTDICVHLSLSAISLALNLQSQVAEALQFGNPVPLAPCTNYDRVWVSPEENGILKNLTFWRPQAPSNYVILGDCVTSRSTPPSQAVLAVSNTYGRVRMPLGFDLIGLISGMQGVENNEGYSNVDDDCSLWMPVAPPGYMALGCVANAGNQPPLNHTVYCIRSDLVTSATYTDCILTGPSNHYFPSGFSIWRLDNVLGSFYAHALAGCPPNCCIYDLSHLLLSNWNCQQSFSKELSSNIVADDGYENEQRSNQSDNPSGWEVVRSISKVHNYFISIPNFERIWWDKGSDLRRPVSIWRPVSRPGYGILGDCITDGLEPPALGIIFKADNPEISGKPVQFTKVAHIMGRGFDEIFFWYPVAPPGYVSVGCVVSKTDEAPHMNSFCCPRMDLVNQANIVEVPISRSSSSKSSQCWSIWRVENQACTFLARADLKKPSSRLAYSIGDSVKPKTRENITAEMKLRFFSVTVLDSLCGMMTPLFDMTITNIKLATHGREEAMNAVLICSIAASAFNTQLEAWEPLVEPFNGILKFETYDTNVHPPATYGKRMRVAATSILNINVSAASLETFVQTIISWRRQLELDEKATRLNEKANSHSRDGEDHPLSALDEDDFQTVTIENKLGCDIYLKRVEQDSDTVDLIHYNDCASLWIPPPRFSDRLNVADESRDPRYYVSILILEAKDLPIIDDGNSHKLFCALRLVVDSPATDQLKVFPQSARTRCVTPLIYKCGDHEEGTARWNELFIFEVPRKGVAKLEVEVTNLAAKAGKGDVVGAFSFSVGQGANMLKKMTSARMLQQPSDCQNIMTYPLRSKGHHNDVDCLDDYGHVMVSTSCFERKSTANIQGDSDYDDGIDRDVGFWLGLGPEGVWESIRSVLPLSVVPKALEDNIIAIEVVMKNGKTHTIIRGLVTVVNDCDVRMDVAVCFSLSANTHDSSLGKSHNILLEEIFENERYAPSARGNKWSGLRSNDPGIWSTRDFSNSSKEFFEPPLPSGWQWTSTWTIDKSESVDEDGWAYGSDFQSLKWPPTSSKSWTKSSTDVVRRRRWTRTRQQISEKGIDRSNSGSICVDPGCSVVLPWRCTFKNSDQFIQVRPIVDHPNTPYNWGCGVAVGYYTFGKDQPFMDQALLTRQNTSKQGNKTSNFAFKLNELEKKDILMSCPGNENKQFWLSVGTDASVLHTELNTPVYDWKISINSPLKLENRLPCPAEFAIWEKPKEGNIIKRQHGVISSRGSVHIYSADLQKPVYLSLFAQGCWVLEKDPLIVLDLSTVDRVSSFWMVHKQSKRRLRVSIERDFGGSSAAPKTISFFVPYWIVNDSFLSLAYRLVEIEPTENANEDPPAPSPYLSTSSSLSIPVSRSMSRSASPSLSRAVKSAKFSFKHPTTSMDSRRHGSRRSSHVFEHIDDTSPTPSMLSPQDYTGHSGTYSNQKDTYLSPRLGIAVAIRNSETYGPGISLLELDKKQRVNAKAFGSDGSYYKLSALLNMTSDRTKVIHFQPHTLFINRAGCSLCLQQCDTPLMEWIHPTDAPKTFEWQSYAKTELLRLRVEGYKWSTPFSVSTEGVMRISMKKENGADEMQLRVAVRSGAKSSSCEVIIRPNSSSSPYRIENRSMFLPIQFRQVEGVSDSWRHLLPNATASFFWEDLGRERLLELLIDGADPLKTEKYNIDEIFDHQPIPVACSSTQALCVTIFKEEKMNVVRISDWMPEIEHSSIMSRHYSSSLSQDSVSTSDCEFHVIVELAELGLSIIDHTPEEILYLSVQSLLVAHSTGLGSGISRFKIRMQWIQVDNQLPLTPMPVLFRPQKFGGENDNILKFSITMQSNGSLDLYVYPYLGFHGPENSAFLINIPEPIIWRLHEMVQQVNLSTLSDTQTTAVSVDPIIEIGVLNISEVRCKVSMAMSPNQRPRGVLGFWLSLMTTLGNTENMPIRINQKFHENVCMRQSSMVTNAISDIQKDLLGQPLQLLSGVDILGNASSALGHMSKGVAALSMDKKFIQSRQRQESKGVEDFGDVIREGGGALAKGLFRGVTGILTKPLEGAKSSGVEGFVQGVGKGIIGAAAQPVSGVLDLLSKTTEGANAVRMKIASAITSDEQLLRIRLPRAIGGDNLVRPYDEYRAQGQVILQLAESGSFFGQVDLFKVRGKFALSDAFEDHFLLRKGKILAVTHRRIILLQQPSNVIGQRKFSPARDPCSILWYVRLGDVVTMEFTRGKKDIPNGPPSKLIFHIKSRSSEHREQTRTIKCSRETPQSIQVYSSVEQAMRSYGPNQSMDMLKKKVRKPYSPIGDDPSAEAGSKGGGSWSPQQVSNVVIQQQQ